MAAKKKVVKKKTVKKATKKKATKKKVVKQIPIKPVKKGKRRALEIGDVITFNKDVYVKDKVKPVEGVYSGTVTFIAACKKFVSVTNTNVPAPKPPTGQPVNRYFMDEIFVRTEDFTIETNRMFKV